MALLKADIETIVVGQGPVSSLLVLKTHVQAPRAATETKAGSAQNIKGSGKATTPHQDRAPRERSGDAVVDVTDNREETQTRSLPIKIGAAEAAALGMLLQRSAKKRPMTFDLLENVIQSLGAKMVSAAITGVKGTTFYARIDLIKQDGTSLSLDARPTDAIGLAIRSGVAFYVEENVLTAAGLPDFAQVKRQEEHASVEEFHDFIKRVKPEDFS